MQVRTAILRFSADSIQVNGFAPFFRLIPPENGCGMSKFCTMSSKLSFFSKKAEILRKVEIDTTDSLAEGVSCRQPTAVPLRQKIPPAKREQEQKRAGSQRNQLQFLLQAGTCGRILSEKFTNMFRRLIPVIQLIKQFIFIDSGINVFVMLRLALAAMATSVAAVSASTFHFSVIFHFLRFFSLRQQSYNIFRYRPP